MNKRAITHMRKVPLLIPDMPSTDALIPWLRQIDENLWYTNFGPLGARLESRLLEALEDGAPLHIALTANATLALELALGALRLPPNSTVLTPALTFVATGTAILRAGCQPVFADVDDKSWLLTPAIARKAVAECEVRAIMPVATFGCPQDAHAWDVFSRETGIPVIVDAAGAFGNQRIGTDATFVFSFHATKALGAGEGGCVVGTQAPLIERVRFGTNFGIEPEQEGRVFHAGTNAKMSEYHAAVGHAALDQWRARKTRILELKALYRQELSILGDRVRAQAGTESNVQAILPLRVITRHDLAHFASQLGSAGIGTRRWYCPPLYEHPLFSSCAHAGALDNTRSLAKQILGLPFHSRLTAEDIRYVVHELRACLDT